MKKKAQKHLFHKEFLAGEPKRKKRNIITWTILLSIIAIFIVLIIVAVSSDSLNSGTSSSSGSLLTNKQTAPYTSAEHGFVINFPGLPEAERQTLDESGYKIPYTIYSADTDNGIKPT